LQGEPCFAVANGDGVIVAEDHLLLKRMREWHERENALATILVCPLEGVGKTIPGVWMDPDGTVRGFGKSPPVNGIQCYHYASFMILSERIWKLIPEGNSNILYDVVEPALGAGEKVLGYKVERMRWYETGKTADFLSATKECLVSLTNGDPFGTCLQAILKNYSPESALVVDSDGGSVGLVHANAQIAPSARLEGFYVLGENAVVEEYAKIRNSVLLPGTRVLAGSAIDGQILISG
jgi:NDP-sugar pyrophosphorylase family protein